MKEQLYKIYQALETISVRSRQDVATMSNVFSFLEMLMTECDTKETEEDEANGAAVQS